MLLKTEMLNRLTENGVMAVLRKVPENKVIKVAESLINGGVNVLEVTVDDPEGYKMIKQLTTRFENRAIIGAGTVVDSYSAKAAIDQGAEFIVSPTLNKSVIATTRRYGKISVPGVMTPTEAMSAVEFGADIVKLFPASVVGPSFIKNINGPLPQIPIIPTGGINIKNAAEYIKAGAIAIGAGGNLVNSQLIEQERWGEMESAARDYTRIVQEAR